MGERTKFHVGHKAPNDGMYMEVGEDDFHMGIMNPRRITLKKGQKFPQTKNQNRMWARVRKDHNAIQ